MSMLIKGISFPTKENFMTQLYLICDKDGNWYAVDTTNKDLYKLIEVKEPHGRLIDADELINDCEKLMRMLDPESKEYLRVFAIKSYLMWAAEYAVIEAEDGT